MINFGFSAIYEEVLYRAYLPEALILLFRINVKENTKFKYISLFFAEAIGALLFAFAHIYAGWLSVLNAILAHLILRLIYRKTGNIYINITAHWLYNLLILLVF
ncbi:MAG: CPBP family intramembrane metalloprotease [Treponema sp.]|nr:CPBP family intramembrane metalloprotease [Treponema sp.]